MGRPKKGAPKVVPTCHPELKHQAFGLCMTCYTREYTKRRRVKDPNYERYRGWEYHLKTKYKLTPEMFNNILCSQGGHCALCSMAPDDKHKNFCVDHDHSTGRVRGILCKFCNSKLGWFENRRAVIESYINR